MEEGISLGPKKCPKWAKEHPRQPEPLKRLLGSLRSPAELPAYLDTPPTVKEGGDRIKGEGRESNGLGCYLPKLPPILSKQYPSPATPIAQPPNHWRNGTSRSRTAKFFSAALQTTVHPASKEIISMMLIPVMQGEHPLEEQRESCWAPSCSEDVTQMDLDLSGLAAIAPAPPTLQGWCLLPSPHMEANAAPLQQVLLLQVQAK